MPKKIRQKSTKKGHSVVIDGTNITVPGNVDGVDISTHAANASAHHAKTINASELTAGLLALARLPATLTGKDADTVDGAHKSDLETTMDGKITTHKGDASAHHAVHLKTLADHALGTVVPHDALASLTEKAHGSLTGVTASQHHVKYSHPSAPPCRAATAAQTGHATATQISKLDGIEAQANKYIHPTTGTCPQAPKAHTLASHSTKAHSELTGVTASQHHAKYTDAEAKAAAVQAGAITNGVTKAPTHDAVYDVKVTADTATTPAEVDAKITTHKGNASAHHTKYTHPSTPPCRAATAAQTGHATAAQISKLDGIEAQANKYTHPTTGTCPQSPKVHKASHQPGGSDPMAVDTAAGTGSLRTLGTGAQQAAAGNHTHTLSVTEEWAEANAAEYTNAQEWTTDRGPTTVSSSKKIAIWLQAYSEYTTGVTGLGSGRILVDDVEKMSVSVNIRSACDGVSLYSMSEHWAGNGGVVKAQAKTAANYIRTRTRTGMHSIGV